MANEIGLLGLPREFSNDSTIRNQQRFEIAKFGFDRMKQRYGRHFSRHWQPTPENLYFAESDDHYIELVELTDKHAEEIKAKYFFEHPNYRVDTTTVKSETSRAFTNMFTQETVFNMRQITVPHALAVGGAHEGIHATSPIEYYGFRSKSIYDHFGDKRTDLLDWAAMECLVQTCTLESLGLLKPDITKRGFGRELIHDVILRLRIMQVASVLGKNPDIELFKIVQSKYSNPEVRILNQRMKCGLSDQIGMDSYFDWGILVTSALFQLQDEDSIKHFHDILSWIQFKTKSTKLQIMTRPDFQKAIELEDQMTDGLIRRYS